MTKPAVRPAATLPVASPQGPNRGLAPSGPTLRFAELLQQRRPLPVEATESEALAAIDGGAGACGHEVAPDPDEDAELHGEDVEPTADTQAGAQTAPPITTRASVSPVFSSASLSRSGYLRLSLNFSASTGSTSWPTS